MRSIYDKEMELGVDEASVAGVMYCRIEVLESIA